MLGLIAWRLTKVKFITLETLAIIGVLLLGLYLFQAYNIWQANKPLMIGEKRYAPEDRYRFSQVFNLEMAYVACFGSELAVVSMLPTYFERGFGLTAAAAGAVAGMYAFMNLVARPGGGLLSDKLGSRKLTLVFTMAGTGIGYLLFSLFGQGIPIFFVVIMTMAASFFVMATEGATYAIVPLIKPRITGQIAGNVGAYGNVGAVVYLTVYSLLPEGVVGDKLFFQMLGCVAIVVAFLIAFTMKEVVGSHAEHGVPVAVPQQSDRI